MPARRAKRLDDFSPRLTALTIGHTGSEKQPTGRPGLDRMVILLGVVAGGVLAGIIGSIIATPILAAASGIFGYLRERQAAAEHASSDEAPVDRAAASQP